MATNSAVRSGGYNDTILPGLIIAPIPYMLLAIGMSNGASARPKGMF